jgi:hypothetical protein
VIIMYNSNIQMRQMGKIEMRQILQLVPCSN